MGFSSYNCLGCGYSVRSVAVGALHRITVEVAARDYLAARLRAYDAHEHSVGGVEGVRATLLPAVASADG